MIDPLDSLPSSQPADIVKRAYLLKILEPLVDLFLTEEGISKGDMLRKIAELTGKRSTDPEVDIMSLNFVGSLRSVGYIVSGGRYRRLGENYRILGFETPKIKPTTDQWSEADQMLLRKFQEMSIPMGADHVSETIFREAIAFRGEDRPLHEMSWMYASCYELGGKSRGYFWEEMSGLKVLIFQRDVTRPSFRILPLSGEPADVYLLAQQLGRISVNSVKIVNATMKEVEFFKTKIPTLYWERGKQAVYSCEDILSHPEKYFNERARTTLRKNLRSSTFMTSLEMSGTFEPAQSQSVIDRWRKYNEPKQRQLAITRDYLAVTGSSLGKISILGFRDGYPCCLHILDRLTNHPEYAAQIVEKSLNYSAILGGAPGTADLNLHRTCEYLISMGIKFINAGMYMGGTDGLARHKLRLRFSEETDQASLTITTPFRRNE
ncbi:MAG: hypothetical protein QUS07_07240 [Methanothrix sp.]|nr:hypothetical protein [Methanothrix sp.]